MSSVVSAVPTIAPMALLGLASSGLSIYSLLRNGTRRRVVAALPTATISTNGLTITNFMVRLAPMGFVSPVVRLP